MHKFTCGPGEPGAPGIPVGPIGPGTPLNIKAADKTFG